MHWVTPGGAAGGARFLIRLKQLRDERDETDEILIATVAAGLCPGDDNNPQVRRLAVEIVTQFWTTTPDGARPPRRLARLASKFTGLDAHYTHYAGWRKTLANAMSRCVSNNDIDELRLSISCTEAPSSARDFGDSIPVIFLVELGRTVEPPRMYEYRQQLRAHLAEADARDAQRKADIRALFGASGTATIAGSAAVSVSNYAFGSGKATEIAVGVGTALASGSVSALVQRHRAKEGSARRQIYAYLQAWTVAMRTALATDDIYVDALDNLTAHLRGELLESARTDADPQIYHLLSDVNNLLWRSTYENVDTELMLKLLELENGIAETPPDTDIMDLASAQH